MGLLLPRFLLEVGDRLPKSEMAHGMDLRRVREPLRLLRGELMREAEVRFRGRREEEFASRIA